MSRALIRSLLVLVAGLFIVPVAQAQNAQPDTPENVRAKDISNHSRDAIRIRWDYPGDKDDLTGFEVQRAVASDGTYIAIGIAGTADLEFIDEHKLPDPTKPEGEAEEPDPDAPPAIEEGVEYVYQVIALGPERTRSAAAQLTEPVSATPGGWTAFQRATRRVFEWKRFWLLIITFIFCSAVVYWISHARKGGDIKVRKIAGLEAVDEAVGRATEMGRSVLFIPGIQDMNDIQTIAGITVLSRVAKTAAEYDARVEVPTARSLVMTTAREAVQASFLAAGRPDAYNEDLIYYVTDEQFGYVAYLQGMMVREKPAACFYMGHFFAESLILAETGNLIGAIQVAGTAAPAQLPFFVAACDYTLIGEEFFAATAYLSGSPEELGSLKGQDFGKIIVAVGLMIGVILATVAAITHSEALSDAVNYLKGVILT